MDYNFKYSVVIPMYNAEETIIECIDSVIKQTYDNYEIIIVNDGSRDNSLSLVNDYKEKNFIDHMIIVNKKNEGVSKARNTAMDISSAEFIAFLDADDTWNPQKLEVMNNHLTVDIDLYANNFYINNQSIPLVHDSIRQYKFTDFIFKNYFDTSSVVIRNNSDYRFDETMRYTEDHDLWLRILNKTNKALLVNKFLTIRNRPLLSSGGASGNKWEMRKGEMKMFINLANYRKDMMPLLPFLLVFSLIKHIVKIVF
ncbi:glycosyltransferase family 2 protein [Siphonobacter sp. SORGH_AS_1065]|uniref:glycosyltransferase family 2 protein n=1 Tax=Siphonobacter sp. SORGH_AS_1065 TaxID=3041795 RepID=UPI0027D88620|nr:glycosyltransferase family 2 protein [Siphonobacter sp. SORGH_AS_1065]